MSLVSAQIDERADTQVALLYATHRLMSRGSDRVAQSDIEGLTEFRRAVEKRFPVSSQAR
jgi:hypothetical protein